MSLEYARSFSVRLSGKSVALMVILSPVKLSFSTVTVLAQKNKNACLALFLLLFTKQVQSKFHHPKRHRPDT
jgi:hypothetical protein